MSAKRPRLAAVVLITLLAAVLWRVRTRDNEPTELLTLEGFIWTTVWSVKVSRPPNDPYLSSRLRALVETELDAVDSTMSRFRDDSVLARFNGHKSTEPFPVPEELRSTVALALEIGARSGGAYDVTVGPLMRLWGFGTVRGRGALPGEAEIAAARARVGYEHLSAAPDPATLTKSIPDLEVDLSSIAKGHAVDRITRALEGQGLHNFMVEIGGDIRVRGRRPDGGLWRIGVERPFPGRRELHRVLELSDQALASSGEYRNHFEVEGVLVSHTLDPREGRPVAHPLGTVTVVAATAAEADAWATAMNVLGAERGIALADERGLAVLFLTQTASGELLERASEAFTWIR